jgi:DNA helicase HerA-like ATPase
MLSAVHISQLNIALRNLRDSPACFQVPERGQTRYIDSIIDLIEHLYQVTSQSQDKTLVVADEAHNVSGVGRGRQILTRWVREARDTNTAITVVSQSASDFTQYEEGRTLLDQCPGKVFFRHQRVSDDIVDHFKLSEQEVIDLYNLKTGTESSYSEAILKVSGRLDAKIRVEATPAEHRLIEQ